MKPVRPETAAAAERLFGIRAGAKASEWLGISDSVMDEGTIVAALRARLEAVNRDSSVSGAVGDELRDQLHAAAEAVLAPDGPIQADEVRPVEVVPRASSPASPSGMGGVSSGGGVGGGTQPDPLMIAIREILASEGGFTPLASMRLAQLAKLNGLAVQEVIDLAKQQGGNRAAGVAAAPTARPTQPPAARPVGQAAGPRAVRPEGRPVENAPARSSHTVVRSVAKEEAKSGDASRTSRASDFNDFATAEAEAEQWNRRLKTAVVGGGIGLAALAVGLIVLGLLLSKPPQPPVPGGGAAGAGAAVTAGNSTQAPIAAAPTATATPTDTKPVGSSTTEPKATAPVAKPVDVLAQEKSWNDLLRELAACNEAARMDARRGSELFGEIAPQMATAWTATEPSGLVAATSGIVDLAYAVADDAEAAERFMSALPANSAVATPTADEIPKLVFGAGVMARLAREVDLPVAMMSRVQARLAVVLGDGFSSRELSFEAGARASLARLIPRLLPLPDSAVDLAGDAGDRWRAWSRGVTAIEGDGTPARDAVVLRALGLLLTDAPDPATNRGVHESIGVLTTAVLWRKGSAARTVLLDWLAAPMIASSDLHAVTAAIAMHSAAEGIDTSMILPVAASESQRAELRERYATVWGLAGDTGRAGVFEEWSKLGESIIDAEPDTNPLIVLSQAVLLARLNASAALLWSGESGAIPADLMVLDVAAAKQVTALDPNMGKIILVGGGDEAWAVQYLKVGENIPRRRELLGLYSAEPDPLSAAVLVKEACRGTPIEVRNAAQELVRRYSTSVEIVNALLNLAPLMPATRDVSDLVRDVTLTQLPPVRSTSWRVAVRRALVERLLQRVAEAGEFAAVETFAASLAGALETDPLTRQIEMVPVDGVDPMVVPEDEMPEAAPPKEVEQVVTSGPAPGDPNALEMLAMRRHVALERQARAVIPSGKEPKTVAEVTASMKARLVIASGPVQAFAARQFGSAELLGFIIVAERPSRAEQAGAILENMHEARTSARHVFEQIYAAERAMTRLWRLRFSENAR